MPPNPGACFRSSLGGPHVGPPSPSCSLSDQLRTDPVTLARPAFLGLRLLPCRMETEAPGNTHSGGGQQGAEGTLSREMGREPGEGSCCFPGAEAVQEPETQKGPLLGAPAGHRARAGRRGEGHADLCLPGLPCPAHISDKPR